MPLLIIFSLEEWGGFEWQTLEYSWLLGVTKVALSRLSLEEWDGLGGSLRIRCSPTVSYLDDKR